MEKVIKDLEDQLGAERRKNLEEQQILLKHLCKAETELEEMKVRAASLQLTVQYNQVLLPVAHHKPFE